MMNMSMPCKIHVYAAPADMRKGIDGLSGMVRGELKAEPTDGSLFVFINRRRDRMKILFFEEDGFWLYYRLLEAGTFEELKNADQSSSVTIDATQLAMLLSGISLKSSERRRKRYSQHSSKASV
jgi:transposase